MIPKTYLIDIVEVGDYYIERLVTIRSHDRCTVEEAKKMVKDAGYQVIDDICTIVNTMHEVQITVAVEPEYV
jgi:hypothetical protein